MDCHAISLKPGVADKPGTGGILYLMAPKRKRREKAKATRGVAISKWRNMWLLFLFARAGIAGIAGIAAPLLGGARIAGIAALFRGARITRIAALLGGARIARLALREFDDVLGDH
ncbi:MAG: hypothetical protein IIA35_01840 [Proteobacteria bacterium]|nr:hypothetical protein [Pseudomonadota bacterium]